jgi:hypothetical protein
LFEVTPSPLKVPSAETEYKIDRMRGNNCNDWPKNLKEFHEEINKVPWNGFSYEPTFYFDEFLNNCLITVEKFGKKIGGSGDSRGKIIKEIELIVQIVLMISLKTNNQTFILSQL